MFKKVSNKNKNSLVYQRTTYDLRGTYVRRTQYKRTVGSSGTFPVSRGRYYIFVIQVKKIFFLDVDF